MSGSNVILDTSFIINLLNGVTGTKELLTDRYLSVSVITEIEVLSFQGLTPTDRNIIRGFVNECNIIELTPQIKELTILIRSRNKIKIPDAIIAATAIHHDLPLLTMDKGFNRVADLQAVIISL